MELKLVFIIFIFCFIFGFNTTISAKTDWTDAIEKWTAVGVNAHIYNHERSIASAMIAIETLGKAIPYGSAVATIISGLLSLQQKTEFSIVLEKLSEMNTKLDRIDEQLKELIPKIETIFILNNYKSKIEEIINLKNSYKRFTSNLNRRTSDDFKHECVGNKMMKFAKWIEREVNAESYLPLQKIIIEGYDMANLVYWYNQILAILTDAIFLHSTCLGISENDESIINSTMFGTNGQNGDIHEFERVLKNVTKGINFSKKEVKRLFFEQAKKEIESFLSKNERLNNDEFTSTLSKMLTTKYFWRYWVVSSWDDNTKGWNKHAIYHKSQNSWYWHHQHKRNLLVGSILPNYLNNNLREQVEKCRLKPINVGFTLLFVADQINKYLQSCIGTNWDSIAVIRSGNGLSVKFNNTVVIYENRTTSVQNSGLYQSGEYCYYLRECKLESRRKVRCYDMKVCSDFNVIVVPFDITAIKSTGELCPGVLYCAGDSHCCQKNDKLNFYCSPDTNYCV